MLIAIITSLFIAIQDPIVQNFAVRFAGGFLSEKTGADIKVGRLVVTPDLRIFIDDVVVKDLKNSNLAKVGELRTKINVGDLLEGKIHLENVELRDTKANLIKYEGEDQFNFAFLAEAFGSKEEEKPEKEPLAIIIDKILLKNVDFVYWNQNEDHPEKTEQNLMDYSHIGVSGVHLEATDFYMFGDSIHANIGKLRAKERSGFDLKLLRSDVVVCSNGIYLDGLQMETNNSRFDLDLHMLYDEFADISEFVDSVVFDATIRPTDIMLSDIGVFTSVMYKMPDRVLFEAKFSGAIEHFRVDDFNIKFGEATSILGSLSMHPLDFENGEHTLNIKKMRFNYDDLVNFYIPSSTETIPLPKSLKRMDKGVMSFVFRGSYNNFSSIVNLESGVGNVITNIARSKKHNGDNVFSGSVTGKGVDVGSFANNSKLLGELDLDAGFSMTFPQKGSPELGVNGMVSNAQLLGQHIDEIKLDGVMKENRFNGKMTVDDDDLYLDFNGLVDFENQKYPKSDFEAVIRNANLNALHIMNEDSISDISAKIYVNMTGYNIDDLEGEVRIDSTLYQDSRGSYFMKEFNASIYNDYLMQRRINLNNDFFDFEMAGKVNFEHLVSAFREYVDHYMEIPLWDEKITQFESVKLKEDTEQDFVIDLNLKDTKTLSRLFMPTLKIAPNTSLKGTFTSRTNALNLTLRSKNVQLGDLNFNNLELKNLNFRNAAITSLSLDEIAYSKISETDTLNLGVEKFSIGTRMTNDTLFARIEWDDHDTLDRNKALIETYFHPHLEGGIFSISNAQIFINDSLWTVSPNNFVDINKDKVTISNVSFGCTNQSIRADGIVPMQESDTLSVQLRNFDISNFDFLFASKGFDINGFISGDALVSSLKTSPMVLADLNVDSLGVNGDYIGDANIESSWNNVEKSVELEASILEKEIKHLNVYGSYYTAKETDNLDFTIAMDSLRLAILSPFLVGVVSRLQGYGNGLVTVTGSLEQPEINGRLSFKDGGCKVGYLNTFYTFNPTILIDNQSISFEDMVMIDTLGNKATVEGEIRHNKLKDFYLDLRLRPRDFLAMATTSADNDSFYGTAVANGLVSVKGPFDDIYLSIKALTRQGTSLTIPLNKASTVSDNDFIIFINNNIEEEAEEQPEEEKKNRFSLNLDVDATDAAALKIILPGNLGTIDATGNGNVKLGTATKEPLTMFGKYTIMNGRFQLNLMNLMTKIFSLKNGGTITWSGNPTDGRINATGVYSIKAALSDLGVQVDTTSSASNTVNVECLIHLKDALLNPTISFGMNLPNANEDITQTVYSLVDTTNQAIMTSQVLSLLVLGKFAYAGNSATYQNINFNNFLFTNMQVDLTDNMNLGIKYHSGGEDSYDEYQVALRTELFQHRLTIETNLGVMSSNSSSESNASNIVGEFDLYYKLTKDGKLQGHFYNHSNYNSNYNSFTFDKRAPYTQGLGLSFSKSFNTFRDLFRRKKSQNFLTQPLIVKPKKEENN